MTQFPRLAPVRQRLRSHRVADIPAAVREAVAAALADASVERGREIALTAGSRGIANITEILKCTVAALRERGAEPFIVPAMGSHGGATAEGQQQLLDEAFGINEAAMGCPVRSSMEVEDLGRTEAHGLPVYMDRHAAGAAGVLVINRVKAHTDYSGKWESGLAKMIAIGLGKRTQAEKIHAYGAPGLRELIPEVARAAIQRGPILGGIALVEDGYDDTAEILGLPAARMLDEEPDILRRSKEYLARLPFDDLDLLVIDRMGKEISGTGMDTNVIGRKGIRGEQEFKRPRIERIMVRELTERSHDNAIGMGLADVITRRLYDRIDLEATQPNGLVSTFEQRLMVPVVAANDREALERLFYLLRRKDPGEVRMARIQDTLHLGRLYVSENLLEAARGDPKLEVLGDASEIAFDNRGNFLPADPWHWAPD
jgi:hypothetical protein